MRGKGAGGQDQFLGAALANGARQVLGSILMAMGMMMLPPTMVSMPFKIIFFVVVDGWYLVAGSLAKSFGTYD